MKTYKVVKEMPFIPVGAELVYTIDKGYCFVKVSKIFKSNVSETQIEMLLRDGWIEEISISPDDENDIPPTMKTKQEVEAYYEQSIDQDVWDAAFKAGESKATADMVELMDSGIDIVALRKALKVASSQK